MCAIFYRVKGGRLEIVCDGEKDDFPPSEFADVDDAAKYAENNALFKSGQANYQIVEIEI